MSLNNITMKAVRFITGQSERNFIVNNVTLKAIREIGDETEKRPCGHARTGRKLNTASRTAWVVEQLESGRVMDIRTIRKHFETNDPYDPMTSAINYLKAKGVDVKKRSNGSVRWKQYWVEK